MKWENMYRAVSEYSLLTSAIRTLLTKIHVNPECSGSGLLLAFDRDHLRVQSQSKAEGGRDSFASGTRLEGERDPLGGLGRTNDVTFTSFTIGFAHRLDRRLEEGIY